MPAMLAASDRSACRMIVCCSVFIATSPLLISISTAQRSNTLVSEAHTARGDIIAHAEHCMRFCIDPNRCRSARHADTHHPCVTRSEFGKGNRGALTHCHRHHDATASLVNEKRQLVRVPGAKRQRCHDEIDHIRVEDW